MPDFTAFLVAVGPVAIAITKLVDFVRSFDKGDTWPKGLWIALALVLGVAMALLTGSNFADLIGGLRPEVADALGGTTGEILTGLAVGATASFWHEHLDKTSSEATAATSEA
jgi:hypothetical protein